MSAMVMKEYFIIVYNFIRQKMENLWYFFSLNYDNYENLV